MRFVVALLLTLVVALPALAAEPEPYLRTCSTSQFGDLGRGWQERAVVAGPLAFVGMKNGITSRRAPDKFGNHHKILVVVEPNRVATVTVALRSRAHAALGYNEVTRYGGAAVPLSDGTPSVRFEACGAVASRAVWNRGTQFGGVFLVNGPRRCVHVEVRTGGRLIRRALRFGAASCG
jgi:hypothetical protein